MRLLKGNLFPRSIPNMETSPSHVKIFCRPLKQVARGHGLRACVAHPANHVLVRFGFSAPAEASVPVESVCFQNDRQL